MDYLYDRLQQYIFNGFRPKRVEKQLIREAKDFVSEYEFFWQGGLCLVRAPYGNYIWHFAVEMKQEQIGNYKEFREGYKYGKTSPDPLRDNNPYGEHSRHRSWDCGYILGLSQRS